MILGVDTGGTFTDFVCFDGSNIRFHKVLSTPDDPSRAVFQGLGELGVEPEDIHLVHGSTVATNAILERKGVKTLFVTQKGMEDLLFIGRQNRKSLFDLCPARAVPWLSPDDCFGLSARVDAAGEMIEMPVESELKALGDKAGTYESIAVCMLFSFLNRDPERIISQAIPEGRFVSLSHRTIAEYREYERASTTFLNAYVGPMVQNYLNRLQSGITGRLHVMHSAGGVMPADEAGEQAARLVLSGPAGGLVAAQMVGRQLGIEKLLTFDMGGTSTDVALVDGEPVLSTEGSIAGVPVAVPMLDIHTIGAGGGSLAWLDSAGLPQVGPESAGADPGPASYGKGGTKATVTDANVVLGRIPADAELAGSMRLDVDAARKAVGAIATTLGISPEEAALGVIRIAEEHMAGALRVVSVQRGHDPRQFALLCFGGAGGLHACSVAEKLGMKRVVFPVGGGAFSAVGMLAGRRQTELSRSRRLLLHMPDCIGEIVDVFASLKQEAQQRMPEMQLEYVMRLDLRYEGQGFHLTLPYTADADSQRIQFEEAHESAYGHKLERNIEVMTLRLSAFGDAPTISLPEIEAKKSRPEIEKRCQVYGSGEVLVYDRSKFGAGDIVSGPALVVEATATLWLAEGWKLSVTEHGHMLLDREKA